MVKEIKETEQSIKQKQDYEMFVKFVAEMIKKYGKKIIKKKKK